MPGVAAEWLERNFVYPDWPTNSTFSVVSPLVQTGVNADNLPIAQSVIANAHLEITQRFEMLDTVVGTAMGTTPASAGGAGTFLHSNRYVLKQTYTVKNIAGAAISNVQLFQLLHGLNSQRGVYDNRLYTGQLSNFRYDTTLAGVDAYAAGAGAGLVDFHRLSRDVRSHGAGDWLLRHRRKWRGQSRRRQADGRCASFHRGELADCALQHTAGHR